MGQQLRLTPMEAANNGIGSVAVAWKTFARRLLNIWENRPELLTAEVQKERERLPCTPSTWRWERRRSPGSPSLALARAIVVLLAYSTVAVLLIMTSILPVTESDMFKIHRRLD